MHRCHRQVIGMATIGRGWQQDPADVCWRSVPSFMDNKSELGFFEQPPPMQDVPSDQTATPPYPASVVSSRSKATFALSMNVAQAMPNGR